MPSDAIAISAHNLTKSYRLFGHPGDRIKQFLSLGLTRYDSLHTALEDATFEVRKGESVGIIGRNGSGKSTLLQLVCGILKPTSGHVHVNGRVSALLELGAGFNPEFTGRENVYFQGALTGLTRKMVDERLDDVAAFADIGKFLDQPVRTYSSGMFVRLAFATMIHVDADILVIDEALSVGDAAFQRRCFKKLELFLADKEKILFFVSHHLNQIERMCSRAIWLDEGAIVMDGAGSEVCKGYLASVQGEELNSLECTRLQPNIAYSGEIIVSALNIYGDHDAKSCSVIEQYASPQIVIDFSCDVDSVEIQVVLGIDTSESVVVAAVSTALDGDFVKVCMGRHRLKFSLPRFSLSPGVYYLRLAFRDKYFRPLWIGHHQLAFRITSPRETNSLQSPRGLVSIPFDWALTSVDG